MIARLTNPLNWLVPFLWLFGFTLLGQEPQPTAQPESPSVKQLVDPLDLILLFAIGGAVVDGRYKRRGGVKPTKKDYLYLGMAVLFSVALILWLASIGRSGKALAHITGFLLVVIFGVWELRRWGIRKKNPIPT